MPLLPSEERVAEQLAIKPCELFLQVVAGGLLEVTPLRDYLQSLGINAIEFTPWTAWPGDEFSWGYDPVAFFSVEHRYYNDPATPLDKLYRLQLLINELHERAIQVIMDGVFIHVRAVAIPYRGFLFFV